MSCNIRHCSLISGRRYLATNRDVALSVVTTPLQATLDSRAWITDFAAGTLTELPPHLPSKVCRSPKPYKFVSEGLEGVART